jgi:hypothetical protein
MTPPQLKAFLKNSNVKVDMAPTTTVAAPVSAAAPPLTSPLRYTNFIAEVGPVLRPDVLAFVRQTKPSRKEGNYDVQEISGYHGQFQKAVTHTNLYGFKTHQNYDTAQLKNLSWSFVEFRVVVKGRKTIIARLYKDKMVLQGGCVDNDPKTPLYVAKYLTKKYALGAVDSLKLKYASLDGVFQFRGTVKAQDLSRALYANKVSHFFEPELKAADVRNIEYEGETIDSVTMNGFVTLHKKSVEEIQRAYLVAVKFVERMDARGLIARTPTFAQSKETSAPEEPVRVRVPRIQKLRNTTNVLLNDKMCSKYSTDDLKKIAKAMGIFAKKTWKKKDFCQAIFDKNANLFLESENTTRRNNGNTALLKKRGIDTNALRNMMKNAYGDEFRTGRNVNADVRLVQKAMKNVKTNKKGVPFKGEVLRLVKDVARERKFKVYLNKYDANTRAFIRRRLKNRAAITKKVVENVAIKVKNVNVRSLKNINLAPNVNVAKYAKQRELVKAYVKSVVRPAMRKAVEQETLAWLTSRRNNPTNDLVKRELLRYIRLWDDPRMNRLTMNQLHARRAKLL